MPSPIFRRGKTRRGPEFACPVCRRYHNNSFSTHICPEHGAFDCDKVQEDPRVKGLPASQACPTDVLSGKKDELAAVTYTCYVCRYISRF